MNLAVFENENGSRRINWLALPIFWVMTSLASFLGWTACAWLLSGDWAWRLPLGIVLALGVPLTTLGALFRTPIERLPKRT
jgi:predicted permease